MVLEFDTLFISELGEEEQVASGKELMLGRARSIPIYTRQALCNTSRILHGASGR